MVRKNRGPLQLSENDRQTMARRGFSVGEYIAEGSFGVVYRAMYNDEPCAAKVIDLSQLGGYIKTLSMPLEIRMLKKLRHRNVVEVRELFVIDSDRLIIFMELVEGGDLEDMMKGREYLEEWLTADLYYQTCDALAYIHAIGFAHRDIKPENVLLDRDRKTAKLADFGLAKMAYQAETGAQKLSRTYCGSQITMAPEVLRAALIKGCDPYNPFLADVWSMGCVLYYMQHARHPFTGSKKLNHDELNRYLYTEITTNYGKPPYIRIGLPYGCLRLLVWQFNVVPERRPTMAVLMRDEWFESAKKLKPK